MKCPSCNTTLLKNARFCHSCGSKVSGTTSPCPSCGTLNNSGAKFCSDCGCALSMKTSYGKATDFKAKYPVNPNGTIKLEEQIGKHFFAFIKKRLEEEQDASKYTQYIDRFYESGFENRFNIKAGQLADEIREFFASSGGSAEAQTDELLGRNFENLTEHFIVLHCRDLNVFNVPEASLKYENVTKGNLDMGAMIHDYLQIDGEKSERFYTDFLKMPPHKLKNAGDSYLYADKKEMVYIICDQTVFGSGKEGFAMTERGIYWKAHFNKSQRVYYDNLQEIKREGEWLSVNGRYFHVNPAFNLRMMKLLKKIKSIY